MEPLDELTGEWVQCTARGAASWLGQVDLTVGVLVDWDEGWLWIRTPNGETAGLPRGAVTTLRRLGRDDPGPGGRLLRPASEPARDRLVRPAGPTKSVAGSLLRPDPSNPEPRGEP